MCASATTACVRKHALQINYKKYAVTYGCRKHDHRRSAAQQIADVPLTTAGRRQSRRQCPSCATR